MSQAKGYITQVLGAVVDVAFNDGEVPAILNALHTQNEGKLLKFSKWPSTLAKTRFALSLWTRRMVWFAVPKLWIPVRRFPYLLVRKRWDVSWM